MLLLPPPVESALPSVYNDVATAPEPTVVACCSDGDPLPNDVIATPDPAAAANVSF